MLTLEYIRGDNVGAIKDRLELTIDEVKDWIPDDDIKDSVVETLMDSAKESADNFCNNSFEDDDGYEESIPAAIKIWCLKRIARDYERRIEGLNSEQIAGLGAHMYGENEYEELWPYRRLPGV